ncbi:hypothetical protein V1954_04595 [Yersinia sp. 2538 StPb PI]|uniref:hypothetical protein n=1 Tax=Yersinia sp. 2538 StPb PI TaxID=3117405 RepID=UPI003FA477F7
MKELLILIATLVIWVIVAKFLAKYFIHKGHRDLMSKTSGVIVGAVVAFTFLIIVVIPIPEETILTSANSRSSVTTTIPEKTIDKHEEKTKSIAPQVLIEEPRNPDNNESIKTLGISPDIFEKRMNANLETSNSSLKLKINLKKNGVNNTFNYAFNDHLVIVGTIDKPSQKLSEITLITSGDGTAKSGIDIGAVVVSAFSATLGENTMKTGEPGIIVMKLMAMNKSSTKDNEPSSTIFNGIKFSFFSSDTTGYRFTAEPA